MRLRIIYSCYGGAHSSPVAAAIHLGHLPRTAVPPKEMFLRLKLFDRTTAKQHGDLMHIGIDNQGNQIYVLGRGPSGSSMERAFMSGVRLAGGFVHDIKFVDTLPTVNFWMRIGGFLSRALGWVVVGRPIVLYGIRRAYPRLVRLVEHVERNLADGWPVEMGRSGKGTHRPFAGIPEKTK